MTVNSIQAVSVSIAPSPASPVCQSTSVTFTPTPTNGGSTPSYQWYLNGSNVSSSSTYTTSTLPVGSDNVYCILTSSVLCPSGNPATSSTYTMTVNPLPIADAGGDQSLCSGSSITLGTAPVPGNTYLWSPTTGLSSSTTSNPILTLGGATATYTYTLTETITATGCSKSNSILISVINGGSNPSFTCNSTNLVVSTPSQYLGCVNSGSTDWVMMRVQIIVGGGCGGGAAKLQNLHFLSSSNCDVNITNAKL